MSRAPQPPSTHRIGRVAAALLVLVFVLGACGPVAGGGGGNPFTGGGAGSDSSIRVEVQNLNFNDATLHALSSGQRFRMGRVGGKSNANFQIPWQSQEALRIEIDLLASGSYTTNSVSVAPRDQVQLVIQPQVRRSYLQR